MPGLVGTFHHLFLLHAFDTNEWCVKNGLSAGGLKPEPLSHEFSALTIRQPLLA